MSNGIQFLCRGNQKGVVWLASTTRENRQDILGRKLPRKRGISPVLGLNPEIVLNVGLTNKTPTRSRKRLSILHLGGCQTRTAST